MDVSSDRIEASLQAMKLNYPAFTVGTARAIGANAETTWSGWIQPLRSLENLDLILADIAQERDVLVLQNGEVIHKPDCQRNHPNFSWIKKLKKPDQAFKIKIVYAGAIKHPRAYIIEPSIPEEKRKHMFIDGAVCAYAPWKNVWDWKLNTVSDFADQVAIWLIKWAVWKESGIWIGGEMRHNKVFLYLTIPPSAQCWCGKGKSYEKCHRTSDEIEMFEILFSSQKNMLFNPPWINIRKRLNF